MSQLTAWWHRQGGVTRTVIGALLVVIGFNALLGAVNILTGGRAPGGPSSSSFATAPSGVAAWADLLERAGHPVQRLRDAPGPGLLSAGSTLVVADPGSVPTQEREAIAAFVRAGGRLVATGRGAGPLLTAVMDGRVRWSTDGSQRSRLGVPVPEVAGVEELIGRGRGQWSDAGPMLPVMTDGGHSVVLVGQSGAGRVIGIADASLVHNQFLAKADNAAFSLRVVGEAGRPVAFAETYHGFRRATGLAGLPARWKLALALAAAAALVWLWARGRRLGRAEELVRPLPPARREYVDAMAALLLRTRDPVGSIEPVRAAARQALGRRLAPTAVGDEAALRTAAVQAGLQPDEVAAIFGRTGDEEAVLASGRALARLERGAGGQGTA